MQMLFGATDAAISRMDGCCLAFLLLIRKKHGRGLGISLLGMNSNSEEPLRKLRKRKKKEAVIAENFECTSPRRILCLLRRLHNQSVLQSMNQSINKSIDQSESRLVGQ